MTKTNSTADFFLKYFRYKLLSGKYVFFLSVIMGVLSFVQSAVMVLIISVVYSDKEALKAAANNGISYFDYWAISNFLAIGTGAVMLGIVIAAAIMSFNFYQQRHETDMLGSLPITHRMRFWGDFLSGYAISVLPFSLLGVLSIPIVGIAEGYLETTLYTEFFAYVVLTTFFSMTLLYVFAVLAASVSGRVISTIACLIILMISSVVVLPSAAGFFIDCIVGMSKNEVYSEIFRLTPTLDVLLDEIVMLCSEMPALSSVTDERLIKYIDQTPASQFINIIIWTAQIAALTVAAFFLTKFRKAERTGGAFGHKYGYYAVLFATVGVVFCFSYILYGYSNNLVGIYITAAILSVIVFAVFEICMRRGWKNFGIGAAVLAVSFGISIGATSLVKYTGAFGLSYQLPAADDIEYAWFDDYVFTDKEDIEQLRQNHLEFLEKYGNDIQTLQYSSNGHKIEYKLKNGEVFTRSYQPVYAYRYSTSTTTIIGKYEECKTALESIPLGLKDYESQLLQRFDTSELTNCDILLKGVFGGISIKPEKIRELAEIVFGEYTDDTAKDKIIGSVHFYAKRDGGFTMSNTEIKLDIYESYVKTIEFAKNKDNVILPENDEETLCYEISHQFGGEPHYVLQILKKDLESEKVKELISLLTEDRFNSSVDSSIHVYSTDINKYLDVPTENRKRFITLVLEIFADKVAESQD